MEKLGTFLQNQISDMKARYLFKLPRVLGGEQKARVVMDGKKVITLSSNNYLGLNTHPKLRKAAIEATKKFGVGSGAVRPIAGNMKLHEDLEKRLARFKKTEACLTMQSGFTANTGVIQALFEEGDIIISDELNHASIIDGCRLTKAERKVYPHKDMKGLEKVLKESKDAKKVMVVTDGVFSMDGDIAPLKEIAEISEKHGAFVMVDDAHASGVLGRNGRGTVDHFRIHGKVDLQIGTLSKAIGCLGGYVAGSKDLREYLMNRCRPFLFSTSHPPAVAASCIAAIDVLEQEPELLDKLWENTRYFKNGLRALGFNTGHSETPITPVITGSSKSAMELSANLFKEGVFALSIVFPMVAEDKARIRTIVTAQHTKEDLDECISAFEKVGKNLKII